MFLYLILFFFINSISLKAEISKSYSHYLFAETFLLKGKYEKAIKEYQLAVENDKDSSYLKTKLAKVLLIKGEKKKAKNIFLSILNKSRGKIDIEGMIAFLEILDIGDKKDRILSLNICNKILEQEENNRIAIYTKTSIFVLEKREQESITLLKGYININKEDTAMMYYLATIYKNINKHKLSANILLKISKIDADYTPAIIELIALYRKFNIEESYINKLYVLYKMTSNELVLYELLNFIKKKYILSASLKDEYIDMLAYCIKMLEEKLPYNIALYTEAVFILLEAKEYDIARQTLERTILEQEKNEKIQFGLALALFGEGNNERALSLLLKIGAKSYLFEDVVPYIVKIYVDDENYKELIHFLKNYLIKYPKDKKVSIMLVNTYEKVKKYKLAISLTKKIIKNFGYDKDIVYFLGTLYGSDNNIKKSIETIRGLLEKFPNYAIALNYLGYTYLENNIKFKEARKLIKMAIKIEPNNPYIMDSLAWLHFKEGAINKSIMELKKAEILFLNTNSEVDPVILEHLLFAYARIKDKKEVEKLYKRIIKLDIDKNILIRLRKIVLELGIKIGFENQ